nr:putative reverse transcriptase domain-containing protein [Tanacetum cinerariifolium]
MFSLKNRTFINKREDSFRGNYSKFFLSERKAKRRNQAPRRRSLRRHHLNHSTGESVDHLFVGVRSRQKSYADVRRKPMEFDVGDMVMLKVIERIGHVAYRLELPEKLYGIHNTFHVFNLKQCLADENLVIPLEEIQLEDKLHFIKEPVKIMDHEVKRLKQSRIPIVKIRWNSWRGPKFAWEKEKLFLEEVSASIPKQEARAWR